MTTRPIPVISPGRRAREARRAGMAATRHLPVFLMRHRNLRSGVRVGHTRKTITERQNPKRRLALGLAAGLAALSVLVVLLWVGGAATATVMYARTLPPVDQLKYAMTVQTTKIYDRNGVELYDMLDQQSGLRHVVPLDQVSPLVISATVAAEDATFFTNPGVDPLSIIRAVTINLSGDGQSGASTITQQVVRTVLMSPQERTEHSLNRKVKEAWLAVEMGRQYTKNQIMELYLNQNYYGHQAYGISAAALIYFGKSARDLTLPEAAMLAGLPQAPSVYDPIINPDMAKRRQTIVLDLMAKQGMITQQQADEAKAQTLVLRPYTPPMLAPHFINYLKQYLEDKFGPDVANEGLKVYTTLDMRVQNAAQQVAATRVAELQSARATDAAIVVMEPSTGQILAMVGSVDYNNVQIGGQINMATTPRQPGSSFKPITYVTAFEKGWTPATVIKDVNTKFPGGNGKPYIPHNYDGKSHGWVTVREALANSLNIPAVKALQFAGIQNVIDTAHAMGIKGLNRGTDWYGLSLALGGGEVSLLDMTNAYSTLANGGVEVDANPILKIENGQGQVLYQADPSKAQKPVLDPRSVYMVTSILSDNHARAMEFGLNSPLHTSFTSAAKTGTTDDNKDSWTLGYTPNLMVGVWVGNTDNKPMNNVTGALGAAVIWHNMMETFYNRPEFVDLLKQSEGGIQEDFTMPSGLRRMSACSAAGTVRDLFPTDWRGGCTTYTDHNPTVGNDKMATGKSNSGNSTGTRRRRGP